MRHAERGACASAAWRESIVDGADRPAGRRRPTSWSAGVRDLVAEPERCADAGRRPRSSAPAASRGSTRPQATLAVMDTADGRRASAAARGAGALGDGQGGRARGGDAGQQRDPARLHRRLHAPARRRRLRLAGRAHLRLPDPARRGPVGAGGRGARDGARTASATAEVAARDAARVDAAPARSRSWPSRRPRSSCASRSRRSSASTTCRGRRPRSCPPACCGCCCRCSAARCRACAPTGRWACSIVAEAGGRLVFGLILVGLGLGRHRRATSARRWRSSPSRCGSSASWSRGSLGPVEVAAEPLRTLRSLVGDGWVPDARPVPARRRCRTST